ncbi:MAG: hypothetical protein KDI36_15560 [Pseudomonadales bacterium]|nr:hypothetical protein [Pseudomonadales bacterium]
MSKSVITSQGNGLYIIDTSPCQSYADLLESVQDSEALHDSQLELWDMTQITIDLSTQQLIGLSEAARQKYHRPRKSAIVAQGDLIYGLMRVFSVHGTTSNTTIDVFRTREEAERWLLQATPK